MVMGGEIVLLPLDFDDVQEPKKKVADPEPELPPPKNCKILVPFPQDPGDLLDLLKSVEYARGSVVAAVPEKSWPAVRERLSLDGGFHFTEQQKVYEAPWYVEASKVSHLTAPLRVFESMGGQKLTVCMCDDVHQGNFSTANIGSFDRLWDRGGLAALAGAPDARVSEYIKKLLAFMKPGARALMCLPGPLVEQYSSEDSKAAAVAVVSGSATPSPTLQLLQEVCGVACLVHHLTPPESASVGDPTRPTESSQMFVLTKRDTTGKFRPPICPCCL